MNQPSPASREFRSALVFYGGVSLAIYENGIARAFHDAVRQRGIFGPLLEAVNTRVVVDVIAGSSAGGINGLLLAAALETGAEFSDTAQMWREAGGFGQLLRPLEQADEAASLLRGETYYFGQLRNAFHRMYRTAPVDEDWAKEIDVFVTGTDLAGQFWTFADGLHTQITTKDHRLVFHMKHRRGRKLLGRVPAGLLALTDDDDRRRHVQADVLASVARVTSSFPGAFPPFTVGELDDQRTAPGVPPVVDGSQPWVRSSLGFLAGVDLGQTDGATEDHVLIDGGVLDNRPFGPVLRAIFHRAPSPDNEGVERRVFYVEPDPTVFDRQRRDFSPLQVALGSLISLPGYDSIAADVRRIHEHNDRVRLVRSIRDRAAARPSSPDTASEVYLDALAQAVAAFALGLDPCQINNAPALPDAVAHVVTWATRDRSPQAAADLLRQLDLGYSLRRLFHLLYTHRAGSPLLPAEHYGAVGRALKAFKLLRDVWLKPVRGGGLEALRKTFDAAALDERLEHLQRYVDGCWYRGPAVPQDHAPEEWFAVVLNQELLTGLVEQAARWDPQDTSCPEPLRPIAVVTEQLTRLLTGDAAQVWSSFPGFDADVYPAELAAGIYELDEIELIRIAPGDAKTPGIDGPDKITGDRLGHFSAFLRKDWRTNDIAWGHCDGLRQLLSALLDDEAWPRLAATADAQWMAAIATRCSPGWQPPDPGAPADGRRDGLPGRLDDLEAARTAFVAQPDDEDRRDGFREALIAVAQTAAAAEYVDTIAEDTRQQNEDWGWASGPKRQRDTSDPLAQLIAWKIGAEKLAAAVPLAAAFEYIGKAGLLAWGMLGASASRGVAGTIYDKLGKLVRPLLRIVHLLGTQMRKGRYWGAVAMGLAITGGLGYTGLGILTEDPSRILIGIGVTGGWIWFFDAVLRRRLRALAVTLGLVAVLAWGWWGGGGREVAADGLRKAADVFDGRASTAAGRPVQ